MKQTLFLAIVFAISNLSAQTEKGKFLLHGQFAYASSTSTADYTSFNDPTNYQASTKNAQLNIGFAYFLMNNLALGIGPSYSNYINENKQTRLSIPDNYYSSKYTTNNISLILFLRKYIPLNNQFSLYGQFEFGGGPSKIITKSTDSNNPEVTYTSKGTGFRAGISGGAAWFPSKNFGLHVGLGNFGWNNETSKSENNSNQNYSGSSKSNGFNFSLNTASLQIGLSYFFGN